MYKTNLKIETFGISENTNIEKFPFIVQDIAGLLKSNTDYAYGNILYIVCHEGSIEEQKVALKPFIDVMKNATNWVVVTEAYISTVDYPESEYYLDEIDYDETKKKIPVKEIIESQGKMLEELGFSTIADFVGYEYKDAYILNNELGNQLYKVIEDERIERLKGKYAVVGKEDCKPLLIRHNLIREFISPKHALDILKHFKGFSEDSVNIINAADAYNKWIETKNKEEGNE